MLSRYYGVPDGAEYGEWFMARFPILFQERHLPMTKTCMCWGIECPIGWWHILDQLCNVLEFYNLEFKRNYGIAIIADQVKEKYGTLRFYYHISDVGEDGLAITYAEGTENPKCPSSIKDIVHTRLDMLASDIIREAEDMTETTCAQCGEPLTKENTAPQDGYWIQYICNECNEKNQAQNEKDLEVESHMGDAKAPYPMPKEPEQVEDDKK